MVNSLMVNVGVNSSVAQIVQLYVKKQKTKKKRNHDIKDQKTKCDFFFSWKHNQERILKNKK